MTDYKIRSISFAGVITLPLHRVPIFPQGTNAELLSHHPVRHCASVVATAAKRNVQQYRLQKIPKLVSGTEQAHSLTDPSVAFQNYDEVLDPIEVKFNRDVPNYLQAKNLYQLGLGRMHDTFSDGMEWKAKHIFEILSMITSFQIDTDINCVKIKSRLNCQHILDAIRSTPKHRYRNAELSKTGRTLLRMIFEWRMPTLDPVTRSVLTNFVVKAERIPSRGLVARTDSAYAQEFDNDTLKTGRRFQFNELHPELKGTGSVSHGVEDAETGEYINVVWEMMRINAKYQVFCTKPDGTTEILATFRERPRFLHSFAVTKNYIVIILPPVYFRPGMLAISLSAGDSFAEVPGGRGRFIVISRSGSGVVATYDHPNFSFMHVANAFEERNNLILDLVCTVPMETLTSSSFDIILEKRVTSELDGQLRRFTLLDLPSAISSRKVQLAYSVDVRNALFDLTTINPLYRMKPYTFIYGCTCAEGVLNGAILKINVKTGQRISVKRTGCIFGEPLFIQNPEGTEEDDGVLVVLAFDTLMNKSSFLILNARTLTEVARADLPIPRPLYFHWYLDNQ